MGKFGKTVGTCRFERTTSICVHVDGHPPIYGFIEGTDLFRGGRIKVNKFEARSHCFVLSTPVATTTIGGDLFHFGALPNVPVIPIVY